MLNKIIAFTQTAVAKYKARRINTVIRSFFIGAEQNAAVMLSAYSVAAQHIVNKTEQDSQPLVNLLSALQQCVEHYGPGLSEIVQDVAIQLERNGTNVKVVLDGAINAMKADIKE